MASKSYINFCRYFFYKGDTLSASKRLSLVKLAYQTATDKQLHPKAILIRSDIHDTTTINGQRVKDPKGWHGTFAFKGDDQISRSSHIAIHGYTSGKGKFDLQDASGSKEKPDATKRSRGKPVWPDFAELDEWTESPVGYGHEESPERSKTPDKTRERSKTPEKTRERSKTPEKTRERSKTPEKTRERSKTPEKTRERSKTPEKTRERSKTPEKPKK